MQTNRYALLFSITCFITAACTSEKKKAISEPALEIKAIESKLGDPVIKKFSLSYPENLLLDSNSVIFYCARTFDTSCMVHIQKSETGIKVVYYEILPTFHQSPNDYIEQSSNLMSFDGYSFLLDSTAWEIIKLKTKSLIQISDSLKPKRKLVDGNRYSLYFDGQVCTGDSDHELVFEDFYKSLRSSFLEKVLSARKPRYWKK